MSAKPKTAPSGHHAALRPSSFDAWAACPAFDSAPAGEAAEHGGMLHERLARHLHGQSNPFADLETEDREQLEWAAEEIRQLCDGATAGGIEQKLTYKREGTTEAVYFGTADVVAYGPDNSAILIDYKSGEVRGHRHQLAGYAAALMSEHPEVETVGTWLLFGRHRKAVSYTFTRAEAVELVEAVIAARQNPERQPVACDYCSWCSHKLTCPALVNRALAIAENREDWRGELPTEWHASTITDPVQMGLALTLAKFVETWADGIKHHATELAKSGAEIPGWKLQERRGRKEVTDISEAWNLAEPMLAGNQPAFLSCCALSLPKLAVQVAEATGIPKARAEREIADKLAPVTTEGKPSVSLVRERGKGEP